MGKIRVEFTEDRRVLDHTGEVIESFKAGQVVALSEASARHWLSRNVAFEVQGRARAKPEPSPDTKPEPAPSGDGGDGDENPAPAET
jgi:hypothetical protein